MKTGDNRPKPPANLRPATKRWFKSVLDDYDLEGHHIRLLILAAEAWDQSQIAREVLDKDGQTFNDRFGQPKERPEIGILNNARIAFARLIRELALDVDTPEAPRAPRTRDYGARAA
ncbi:P27 family phage terminase small subunit [Mesorhizobium sp. B2-3-10]|uniref:P27 family phage terminase small subunit n=1 Tax=Mesorhizobium sp. B2-3-10 TaxID=2589954 RepID=UPI00112A5E39|nr:P27 family phage terminase small subunit [Mesorhizobium sp. B2-3-10]TPL97316.1 P27 family phage terminase small subunit [Mesorhizobium sp. B2-3-10]